MPRIFSIELSDPESAMLERAAALQGGTPDEVLGKILRNNVFNCLVSLANEEWKHLINGSEIPADDEWIDETIKDGVDGLINQPTRTIN